MSTDLQQMTVAELDALIAHAQTTRKSTREKRRQELKTEIERRLEERRVHGARSVGRESQGRIAATAGQVRRSARCVSGVVGQGSDAWLAAS